MTPIVGRCLCGGVRFEIHGPLTPIQYCHASRCRKASGTAFAAEVAARASALVWTRGDELVAIYEAPLLRDPPRYRRAFCRVCGSPLPVALEGTDLVVLHAGVLDGDPATRPFCHAFVDEAACWHESDDDLPRFPRRPPR